MGEIMVPWARRDLLIQDLRDEMEYLGNANADGVDLLERAISEIQRLSGPLDQMASVDYFSQPNGERFIQLARAVRSDTNLHTDDPSGRLSATRAR